MMAVVEEATDGNPYLGEKMKQYVPPLLASAFPCGCVALNHVRAATAAILLAT